MLLKVAVLFVTPFCRLGHDELVLRFDVGVGGYTCIYDVASCVPDCGYLVSAVAFRVFLLLRDLITAELCLHCHGSREAGEEAQIMSFVRGYTRQTSPEDTFI